MSHFQAGFTPESDTGRLTATGHRADTTESIMRMKILQPLALASLLAIGMGSASAQTYSLNWNPRSGDVWVDARLSDIND